MHSSNLPWFKDEKEYQDFQFIAKPMNVVRSWLGMSNSKTVNEFTIMDDNGDQCAVPYAPYMTERIAGNNEKWACYWNVEEAEKNWRPIKTEVYGFQETALMSGICQIRLNEYKCPTALDYSLLDPFSLETSFLYDGGTLTVYCKDINGAKKIINQGDTKLGSGFHSIKLTGNNINQVISCEVGEPGNYPSITISYLLCNPMEKKISRLVCDEGEYCMIKKDKQKSCGKYISEDNENNCFLGASVENIKQNQIPRMNQICLDQNDPSPTKYGLCSYYDKYGARNGRPLYLETYLNHNKPNCGSLKSVTIGGKPMRYEDTYFANVADPHDIVITSNDKFNWKCTAKYSDGEISLSGSAASTFKVKLSKSDATKMLNKKAKLRCIAQTLDPEKVPSNFAKSNIEFSAYIQIYDKEVLTNAVQTDMYLSKDSTVLLERKCKMNDSYIQDLHYQYVKWNIKEDLPEKTSRIVYDAHLPAASVTKIPNFCKLGVYSTTEPPFQQYVLINLINQKFNMQNPIHPVGEKTNKQSQTLTGGDVTLPPIPKSEVEKEEETDSNAKAIAVVSLIFVLLVIIVVVIIVVFLVILYAERKKQNKKLKTLGDTGKPSKVSQSQKSDKPKSLKAMEKKRTVTIKEPPKPPVKSSSGRISNRQLAFVSPSGKSEVVAKTAISNVPSQLSAASKSDRSIPMQTAREGNSQRSFKK